MFNFSEDYCIYFTFHNIDDIWNEKKKELENRLKPNLPKLFTN